MIPLKRRVSRETIAEELKLLLVRERGKGSVDPEALVEVLSDVVYRLNELEYKGAPVKPSHLFSLAFFSSATSVLVTLIIVFLLKISNLL